MRNFFAVLLVVLATPAAAQTSYELTPFAGYRWGGSFEGAADPRFEPELSIADSESYGLVFSIGVTRNVMVELSASRQQSDLEVSRGLFDPEVPIGEIDVTYYQLGATWETDTRTVRPFFGGSVGAATLDPDIPDTTSETRFAGTLNAGLKLDVSRYVGFRIEGRAYWVLLDTYDDDCFRCFDNSGDSLLQGEISAGIIFFF